MNEYSPPVRRVLPEVALRTAMRALASDNVVLFDRTPPGVLSGYVVEGTEISTVLYRDQWWWCSCGMQPGCGHIIALVNRAQADIGNEQALSFVAKSRRITAAENN